MLLCGLGPAASFGAGVFAALGGGRGRRGISQPYLGPRGARSRPGDMMTDRVSPACGGCGRSVWSGRPRGPCWPASGWQRIGGSRPRLFPIGW